MKGFSDKTNFQHRPAELPAGLFDRIILAIRQEQELQHTRRLLFGFFTLLIISVAAVPFSWTILVEQATSSGILYFVSATVKDFGAFLIFWQDFGLAILGALPIIGLIAFTANIILALFTLRLFLRKKQFLLKYLMHSFNFSPLI